MKSELLRERNRVLTFVVNEHHDCYAGNHAVTDNAEDIRYLVEEYETKSCCEDNLCIVEYGYFSGRCMGICCRDGKLAAGSGKSGHKQHDCLM